MDIIVYIFMFSIGVVLGSFYTLAVYRIPLKQDITHTRSYCPKCNHKLGFWDLIPVLSYLFLGGKCRYCKNKIRARYITIEILSGITFLLFAILINIDLLNIEYVKVATLIYGIIFLSVVFIITGIYKEYKKVQPSVFNFGIIVQLVYMVYLYIFNKSIYRYIIYIPVLAVMFMIFNKKNAKELTKIFIYLAFVAINVIEISMILIM